MVTGLSVRGRPQHDRILRGVGRIERLPDHVTAVVDRSRIGAVESLRNRQELEPGVAQQERLLRFGAAEVQSLTHDGAGVVFVVGSREVVARRYAGDGDLAVLPDHDLRLTREVEETRVPTLAVAPGDMTRCVRVTIRKRQETQLPCGCDRLGFGGAGGRRNKYDRRGKKCR
ncbi:hypothetical protein Atai01_78940 [Amycolatopsis taiwanensis]|uniref:Uncharacterized protein n=1 Tax=Amycolatopsis taiwanensis TaxID=342230 RepID=A0A9W6RC86_9PSEU|nr:hypothetical protein Atai01_78940 [Amycolatopsis taiwanensis]